MFRKNKIGIIYKKMFSRKNKIAPRRNLSQRRRLRRGGSRSPMINRALKYRGGEGEDRDSFGDVKEDFVDTKTMKEYGEVLQQIVGFKKLADVHDDLMNYVLNKSTLSSEYYIVTKDSDSVVVSRYFENLRRRGDPNLNGIRVIFTVIPNEKTVKILNVFKDILSS